ncbi:MAG: hypothetical protein K9M15_02750 [Candidatus Marinimicrobia bacterium]|nr:hypothetical protein [Candidatus Neomarinimicrobiota bacterium]
MKKIILGLAMFSLLFVGVAYAEEEEPVYGCMRSSHVLYNPEATIDDGSCPAIGNGPVIGSPCFGLQGDFKTNCLAIHEEPAVEEPVCFGLQGDFKTNCLAIHEEPAVEEPVLGAEMTAEQIAKKIIDLQVTLINLLHQLLALSI